MTWPLAVTCGARPRAAAMPVMSVQNKNGSAVTTPTCTAARRHTGCGVDSWRIFYGKTGMTLVTSSFGFDGCIGSTVAGAWDVRIYPLGVGGSSRQRRIEYGGFGLLGLQQLSHLSHCATQPYKMDSDTSPTLRVTEGTSKPRA